MTTSAFEKISAGLDDAIAYADDRVQKDAYRVHTPAAVDVKAIRKQRNLTQEAFAARYGFTIGRLRDWEQNRSSPDASARILLKIIQLEPEAVERALAGDVTLTRRTAPPRALRRNGRGA